MQVETSGGVDLPGTDGSGTSGTSGGTSRTAGSFGTTQTGTRTTVRNLESILNVSNVTAPVTNNNSKTIQAPVSINVTATGSNPEAVGRPVYNVSEQ